MRAKVTRADDRAGGPTLFAGLHAVAIRQVPARFYLVMQLAAPAALQLWSMGWTRSALWMVVASAFGVWALLEQTLDQVGETQMGNPAPGVAIRVGHRVAGLLAGVTAFGLLLEMFFQVMAVAFKCLGCAG